MSEPVYKIIELCGTSKTSIESAIQNAVTRAVESVRNLRWFSVVEARGLLEDDRVTEWQAIIKIGFDVESGQAPAPEKKGGREQGKEQGGEKKAEKGGEKYRCEVCGYVYDPQKGDPTQDIKSGTSFHDLPDTWKCPECGVGKDKFKKME